MINLTLSRVWLREFWEAIRNDCSALLSQQAAASQGYHFLVDQVYRSTQGFTVRGNGLASAFILAVCRGHGGGHWNRAIRVATALELFSKSILIIDDIIDCDRARWGLDSFHAELERYAAARKWRNARRIGQCAGILGAQLLTSLGHLALSSAAITDRMLRFVHENLCESRKALDEMQLADLAFENYLPTVRDWTRMARRRAAAHVSASLELGATLAGMEASSRQALARAGVHLGFMYDIRADLLDSFGPATSTTARGRDLRMRKKPLFLCAALQRAPAREGAELQRLLAAPRYRSPRILEIARNWGIPVALQHLRRHRQEALRQIKVSQLLPAGRQFFFEMIERAATPLRNRLQ